MTGLDLDALSALAQRVQARHCDEGGDVARAVAQRERRDHADRAHFGHGGYLEDCLRLECRRLRGPITFVDAAPVTPASGGIVTNPYVVGEPGCALSTPQVGDGQDDEWSDCEYDYEPPCGTSDCRAYHCGRCHGHGVGMMGHYAAFCQVTRQPSEHHFCCPADAAQGGAA